MQSNFFDDNLRFVNQPKIHTSSSRVSRKAVDNQIEDGFGDDYTSKTLNLVDLIKNGLKQKFPNESSKVVARNRIVILKLFVKNYLRKFRTSNEQVKRESINVSPIQKLVNQISQCDIIKLETHVSKITCHDVILKLNQSKLARVFSHLEVILM